MSEQSIFEVEEELTELSLDNCVRLELGKIMGGGKGIEMIWSYGKDVTSY